MENKNKLELERNKIAIALIRVTPEERELIFAIAKRLSLSPTALIRYASIKYAKEMTKEVPAVPTA